MDFIVIFQDEHGNSSREAFVSYEEAQKAKSNFISDDSRRVADIFGPETGITRKLINDRGED